MGKITVKIVTFLIIIVVLMFLARVSFEYLSEIALIDYITFSGIIVLIIASLTFDGKNPVNQDFLSLITHRELVSRDEDPKDNQNSLSFSLCLGTVGILLIIVSVFMAWL